LKDFASLLFMLFFTWSHSACFLCRILQTYENKNILHTWRWPCRPKNVVKDSENQHNKAVRRRKHNLQNPLNIRTGINSFVSHIGSKYVVPTADRWRPQENPTTNGYIPDELTCMFKFLLTQSPQTISTKLFVIE
jgi:hypothetical protein